jgi:hypothetical protein
VIVCNIEHPNAVDISWIFEFNHMQIVLKLDIHQLVRVPSLRIDRFEELHNRLIVLRFGQVRGLHEERNPVVSTNTVQVSG